MLLRQWPTHLARQRGLVGGAGCQRERADGSCPRRLPSRDPGNGGEQAEFERIKQAYDAGMAAR
jgi:hypothetical protein